MPKRTPVFELDLGPAGGKIRPYSIAEAIEFVDRERQFWRWYGTAQPRHGNIDARIGPALGQLEAAAQDLNNALAHESNNSGNAPQILQQAVARLQDIFAQRKLPLSTTPVAHFISKLANDSPVAGLYAAGYLVSEPSMQFELRTPEAVRGMVEAVLYQKRLLALGLADSTESVISALEQNRETWDERLSEYRARQEKLTEDFENTKDSIVGLRATQEVEFLALTTNAAKSIESLTTDARGDIEALKTVYRAELKLKAPVAYWTNKRKSHRAGAVVAGIATLTWMGVAGYFLYDRLHEILGSTTLKDSPELWKLGAIATGAIVFLWVARVLVRIFLSQLHLAGDASERMTMVQTYLALVEGGNGPKELELAHIIQALFRPASDGIVKDDALPPSVWESLTRQQSPH